MPHNAASSPSKRISKIRNTVTKKATNLTGNPVGPCRTPFNYLSDEAVEEIKRTLAEDKARGMR